MKTLSLLLWVCLLSSVAMAQTQGRLDSLKARLDSIDAHLVKNEVYVTSQVFDSIIYKKQRTIGGKAITDAKIIGVSAAVDDKSATLNVGSARVGLGWAGTAYLQGTLKGSAEDGFTELVSSNEYQKTLSAGVSMLYFLGFSPGTYDKEDQKQLRTHLQRMRNKDILSLPAPITSFKEFENSYETAVTSFVQAFNKVNSVKLADRVRNGSVTDLPKDQIALLTAYFAAEKGVVLLLPATWETMTPEEAQSWVEINLQGTGRTATLNKARLKRDADRLQKQLVKYDSLQSAARWIRQSAYWLGVNYLYNSTKYPYFDISKKSQAKPYQGEYVDGYNSLTLSINSLWSYSAASKWLPKTSNLYLSAGLIFDPKRDFASLSKAIYQRTEWKKTGVDSVQRTAQSEVYDSLPRRLKHPVWQLQGSYYLPKWKMGLEATAKRRINQQDDLGLNGTVGVYLVVKAGETDLLFMPQLRLKKLDQDLDFWKDQATFGFTLAAATLPFIQKDKKGK